MPLRRRVIYTTDTEGARLRVQKYVSHTALVMSGISKAEHPNYLSSNGLARVTKRFDHNSDPGRVGRPHSIHSDRILLHGVRTKQRFLILVSSVVRN